MKDVVYVENRHFVTTNEFGVKFVNKISNQEKIIPFEDIEWIVLDNRWSYFSNAFFQDCIEKGIGILLCDRKHSPIAMYGDDQSHFERLKRIEAQMAYSTKNKNRLWKKIIRAKTMNQALVIENIYPEKLEIIERLKKIAGLIDDGDTLNRESLAARIHFSALFGETFKRNQIGNDVINASLNYGYAILRAAIRKNLAIHGLEMSMGIHHFSHRNSYNLSDDIIEAFRPFVDYFVYTRVFSNPAIESLDQIKKEFYKLLLYECVIDEQIVTMSDAVRICIQSYLQCLDTNTTADFLLPCLKEIDDQ